MDDLAIIYLTANRMPPRWVAFHKAHLLRATKGYPIVSISKTPIDIGSNFIDDTSTFSNWNVYVQLLRGAKITDTPFVAVAEDDSLYSPEHFRDFRPPSDAVAYNRARWSIFSWDPIFCMRQRRGNFAMIAPREYLIDALEERMAKHTTPPPESISGEIGRKQVEESLGVTVRNAVDFYSKIPIVNLCHESGLGFTPQRKKAHGQMQAYDVPYWGKAVDIAKEYLDG
jgi:hypothetical protein